MDNTAKSISKVPSDESLLRDLWKEMSLPTKREVGAFAFHFWHAIRAILAAPFTFIATVFTGAVSYSVLVISLIIFAQVNRAIESQGRGVSMRLYLEDSISEEDGRKFLSVISIDQRINTATYVSKSDALTRLKSMLGADSELLSGLEQESPLPASIEIQFGETVNPADIFNEYEKRYAEAAEVDRIEYSKSFIGYLTQLRTYSSKVGAFLFVVLIAITGLVVSNAARLGLYAHREEIQIMKLLGARDWFVRAPYMIEGALQGILAGVIGLVFGYGFLSIVGPVLDQSEMFGAYVKGITFLDPGTSFGVVVIATLIGFASSLIGTRHVGND